MFSALRSMAFMYAKSHVLHLLVGGVLIAALSMLLWKARQDGLEAATQRAKEITNNAIQSSGEKADDIELDFDQCLDAGRVWSFTDDKCA